MAKTITKKKNNNEPPIFRSLTILSENLFSVVLNMQKDVKMTFGNKMLNTVCDVVFGVTSCYYENSDNVAKLEYAKDALNKLQGIDTSVKDIETGDTEFFQISAYETHNDALEMGVEQAVRLIFEEGGEK